MTISELITETRLLVDADSDSYTATDVLRRINAAYEEVVGGLILLDNKWNFGDSNYTSLPTGTQTLVAGTQTYTFDATLLVMLRAEVLNASLIWQPLNYISELGIEGAIQEYKKTNGLPTEYSKRENFITLYPAPSAATTTLTNGLKVFFQRTADIFTTAQVTTGTKLPGFASPYHVLLAYKAALPYALSYKKDRVNGIMNEITKLTSQLMTHYARRSKDEPRRLIPKQESNR